MYRTPEEQRYLDLAEEQHRYEEQQRRREEQQRGRDVEQQLREKDRRGWEKDQSLVERVQGELGGRWHPSQRCRVHFLARHVRSSRVGYSSRIVSIHLCGLDLVTVPFAVFDFEALRELHLAKNSLRILSAEIGKLTVLRTVDVRDNSLTELPAALADLQSLVKLEVDRNPLQRPPREVIRQGMGAIRAYLRYAPAAPMPTAVPIFRPTASPAPQSQSALPGSGTATVFISYSRRDQAYVDALAQALQQRGFAVWIDNTNLTPGTPDWEHTIREVIQTCHAVILVASPNSRESAYVKDELELARANAKRVIPLWVSGDVWMNSIPLGWGQTQYIDGRDQQFTNAIELVAATMRGG